MDNAEIEKKKHYQQFYATKFDNLEEVDNFLETYSLSKLNQEETDQLNRYIFINDIEYVLRTISDGFTGQFFQTYKEELKPILLKLFQNVEE